MRERSLTSVLNYRIITALTGIFLTLAAICVPVFAGEYTHGFLRYTESDQSVTITSYVGDEEEVTVPSMIAGNPVNVIASGAFAGSMAKTIILPDTIVSIEEGAFSEGQEVVYASSKAGSGEAGNSSEPGGSEEADNSANGGSDLSPVGIYDSEGNLITTDSEGNLILVDSEGNETVLDDTRKYTREKGADGKGLIKNDAGEEVRVEEGGAVSYTDADGNTVLVDPKTGNKTVTDSEGGAGYEEAEISDIPQNTEPEKNKAEETPEGTDSESLSDEETASSEDADLSDDTASGMESSAEEKADSSKLSADAVKGGGSSRAAVFVILACAIGAAAFVAVRKKRKR